MVFAVVLETNYRSLVTDLMQVEVYMHDLKPVELVGLVVSWMVVLVEKVDIEHLEHTQDLLEVGIGWDLFADRRSHVRMVAVTV